MPQSKRPSNGFLKNKWQHELPRFIKPGSPRQCPNAVRSLALLDGNGQDSGPRTDPQHRIGVEPDFIRSINPSRIDDRDQFPFWDLPQLAIQENLWSRAGG